MGLLLTGEWPVQMVVKEPSTILSVYKRQLKNLLFMYPKTKARMKALARERVRRYTVKKAGVDKYCWRRLCGVG